MDNSKAKVSLRVAIFFSALFVSTNSIASVPSHCAAQYARAGAYPGDSGCKFAAAASSGGMNGYYCTGNSGIDWINQYCAGDLAEPSNPNDNGDVGCNGVGNPINVSNGNKYQVEEDYVDYRWLASDLTLTMSRYYNSNMATRAGSFGVQWRSTYDRNMVADYNTLTITAVRHTGKEIQYRPSTSCPAEVGTICSDFLTALPTSGNVTWLPAPYEGSIVTTTLSGGVITEWVLHDHEENVIETYNAEGQLTSIKKPGSNQEIRLTYTSGRLDSVTNSHNRSLIFGYDSYNRISSMKVPGGKIYSYAYKGGAGQPLEYVIYPDETASTTDNPRRQYLYEQLHNALTGIVDEENRRYATWHYDGYNRAFISTHAGNVGRVDVTYADTKSTVKVKTEDNRTRNIIYNYSDTSGRKLLTSINGAAGQNCSATTSGIRYNANGLMYRTQSPEGWITEAEYAQGKIAKLIEGLGGTLDNPVTRDETRTIDIQWDFDVLEPREVNVEGKKTVYTYEFGRVKTITETDTSTHPTPYPVAGRTRQWVYTYTYHDAAKSQVATIDIDGPRTDVNDTTHYEYNAQGLLTLTRDALGKEWRITEHDDNGAPKRIEGPNGVVTEMTYTPRGWLESRTVTADAISATTQFDYYDNGLLEEVTLPSGAQYTFFYDDAQRLTSVKDRSGNELTYQLNPLDQRKRISIKDSSGNTHFDLQREFDDLGRLWKVIGLNSEVRVENHYDRNSNKNEIKNGDGISRFQGFDALNRLTSVVDEAGNDIQIRYDTQDRITSVEDQNNLSTTYIYDGFGFLIQTISPDAGTKTFWRDEAGNLTRLVDANGNEKIYTYDALNRIRTVIYTGQSNKNLTFVYDETTTYGEPNNGAGRLTRVEQGDGYHMGFVYNAIGQITRQITDLNGVSYTTQYQYGTNGILKGMIYPSGTEVGYFYDTQGRIKSVTVKEPGSSEVVTIAHTMTYKPFGPLAKFTMGNQLVMDKGFDLHYRPSGVKTGDVLDWTIGYNPVGNIETITDNLDSAGSQTFGYNVVNQLTSAQSGRYGQLGFDYDPVGNRTLKTWTLGNHNLSETLVTDTAVSNRLQRIDRIENNSNSSIAFAYNDAGSTVDIGDRHFKIDRNERIEEVRDGSTLVATYRYNGLGQRVEKQVHADNSASRRFVYSTDGKLMSEMSLSGDPVRDYVYLNGTLISMVDAATAETVDVSVTLKGNDGKYKKETNSITYQVIVTNAGPATAQNVRVSQTLPAAVTLSSATSTVGSCDIATSTCQLGSLAAGQIVTIDVKVSTTNDKKMDFIADVATDSVDINTVNNTTTKAMGGALGWILLGLLAAFLAARKWLLNKNTAKPVLLCTLLMVGTVGLTNTAQADIYYVSTDHLGTPQAITDLNKNVVWQADYKPFGEAEVKTAYIENNIRFPGQYYDRETGLHYNYFRDYNPAIGRYLQADPIGLKGGLNIFAYVSSNPLLFIDLLGLDSIHIIEKPGPGTFQPSQGADGGSVLLDGETTTLVCKVSCDDGSSFEFELDVTTWDPDFIDQVDPLDSIHNHLENVDNVKDELTDRAESGQFCP